MQSTGLQRVLDTIEHTLTHDTKLMKIRTAREIRKWEEESGERCLEGKPHLEAPSAISELRIHNTLSQPSGAFIKGLRQAGVQNTMLQCMVLEKALLEHQNTKKLYGTENNCMRVQLEQMLDEDTKKPKNLTATLESAAKPGVGNKSRVLCMPLQTKHYKFSSVQFSHSVLSDSLQPHGLQHTRSPCPSPTPGVYSNSCPLSR